MANSVLQDPQGSDWPLGNIVVTAPGTPVRITSLVDSSAVNAPETPTTTTAFPAGGQSSTADEFTRVAQQIIFQAFKAGAGPPKLALNTGNIYIVRKGGTGVADIGIVVAVLTPGQTFVLGSSAMVRNVFSLYRYFIDADTANDACQVTAIIQ